MSHYHQTIVILSQYRVEAMAQDVQVTLTIFALRQDRIFGTPDGIRTRDLQLERLAC